VFSRYNFTINGKKWQYILLKNNSQKCSEKNGKNYQICKEEKERNGEMEKRHVGGC
jgi:hypothetical protein